MNIISQAPPKHSSSANVLLPVRRGIASGLAAGAVNPSNTNAAALSVTLSNNNQLNQVVRNSDSADLREKSGGGASNSSTN